MIEAPFTHYSAVLQAYGLNIQVIFLSVFVFVAFLFVLVTYIVHGGFQSIQIYNKKFTKQTAIYLNQKQKYKQNEDLFNKIKKDLSADFKISKYFGLYHDDPHIKGDLPRVSMGVFVNVGERSKISGFLARHPEYHEATIPETQCLAVQFPYVSAWSSLFILTKLYPKLKASHNIIIDQERRSEKISILEEYNFLPLNPLNRKITIFAPIQNRSNFEIWNN